MKGSNVKKHQKKGPKAKGKWRDAKERGLNSIKSIQCNVQWPAMSKHCSAELGSTRPCSMQRAARAGQDLRLKKVFQHTTVKLAPLGKASENKKSVRRPTLGRECPEKPITIDNLVEIEWERVARAQMQTVYYRDWKKRERETTLVVVVAAVYNTRVTLQTSAPFFLPLKVYNNNSIQIHLNTDRRRKADRQGDKHKHSVNCHSKEATTALAKAIVGARGGRRSWCDRK